MGLIHRCDMCKKIIWSDEDLFQSGTNYEWNTEDFKKKNQIKINNQFVTVIAGINLNCGENAEVCRKCFEKIIKKEIL